MLLLLFSTAFAQNVDVLVVALGPDVDPNRRSGVTLCATVGTLINDTDPGVYLAPCLGYRVVWHSFAVHAQIGGGPGLYHETSAADGSLFWNRRDFFGFAITAQWFPLPSLPVGIGFGEMVETQVVVRMSDAITRNSPYGAIVVLPTKDMIIEARFGTMPQYDRPGLYAAINLSVAVD